jgi:hypothetical protein
MATSSNLEATYLGCQAYPTRSGKGCRIKTGELHPVWLRPQDPPLTSHMLQQIRKQAQIAALAQKKPVLQSPPSLETLKAETEKVFQCILSSKGLSAIDKQPDILADQGFELIIAGAETTSRVLTLATYHLLTRPEILSRLQIELENCIPDEKDRAPLHVIEQLPWLVCLT